jgi:hypothetical protein
MSDKKRACCLCGREVAAWPGCENDPPEEGMWGNNPDPLGGGEEHDRCCDECNSSRVLPARQGMDPNSPEAVRWVAHFEQKLAAYRDVIRKVQRECGPFATTMDEMAACNDALQVAGLGGVVFPSEEDVSEEDASEEDIWE